MKRRKSSSLYRVLFMTTVLSLFGGMGQLAVLAAEKETIQQEKTYESTNPEDDGTAEFDTTYEDSDSGMVYGLDHIDVELIDTRTLSGEPVIYDTEIFTGEQEEHRPEETVEREDGRYLLKSAVLREGIAKERTKYVETQTNYAVEYLDNIPGLTKATVTDEDTGQQLIRQLPLIQTMIGASYWNDDFTFPITVSTYDADTFMLGGVGIPNGANLLDYADAFLDYLNLPADYYVITAISWKGEPYEREGDGRLVREATATGQKLVTEVNAVYGGTVTLPAIPGQYYHCEYVKEGEEEGAVYTYKATAIYRLDESMLQKPSFWKRLLDWILQHPIETICVTMMFLLMIVIILYVLSRKEKEKDEDFEYIDLEDEGEEGDGT